jgi:hypothetical protein
MGIAGTFLVKVGAHGQHHHRLAPGDPSSINQIVDERFCVDYNPTARLSRGF